MRADAVVQSPWPLSSGQPFLRVDSYIAGPSCKLDVHIYIYKAQRFLVTTIRGESAPATVSDGTEHPKKNVPNKHCSCKPT